MQFKAFKPSGMEKIARSMGYQGSMDGINQFVAQDPMRQQQMQQYQQQAMQMARGGVVRMQTGGDATTTTDTSSAGKNIGQDTINRMTSPALPLGGVTEAATTTLDSSQDIAAGTGEVTGKTSVPTTMATTTTANLPTSTSPNLVQEETVSEKVDAAVDSVQAAQTTPDDPRSQVVASQQTVSSVGNLEAAQGSGILMDNPVQREIQDGELISGTGVDAAKAAKVTAQTEAAAAQADPSKKAMVQGQLEDLMQDFDDGATPAWAAGAMRNAMSAMAARGLGSSSLAGQAIVQAAMESALPIAQADATTVARFEAQNLSNRQQSAMLAAEQRAKFLGQEFDQAFQAKVMNAAKISDIANQNFTAEQQIALENSRIANTMNLQNLSNRQALVMAEAAALSQLDVANLNNRQQAAVQNAQNFMQRDLANLSNRQQTELFQTQQRIQGLFNDQAATNAARQFNATSQNQVDQFFANLQSQVSQFNASQMNAQSQFNAGQANTVERFNAEINNQRDQFNAQNQLLIAQSNAQWRREIATADTAAINRANELNANAILDVSKTAYDNLWNYYADTMEWAWKSAESQLDRMNNIAIAELDAKARKDIASEQSSSAAGQAVGGLIGTVIGGAMEFGWGNVFCWVAREVYGEDNVRWFIFRIWMRNSAPKWLFKLYAKHGKAYAKFISDKPVFKWLTKKAMDLIIEPKRKKLNVKVFI